MKLRRLLEYLGFVMGIASTFTLLLVFTYTYFIVGETKVILDFNVIGEAIPEMILLFFGFIGLIFLFFTMYKKDYISLGVSTT